MILPPLEQKKKIPRLITIFIPIVIIISCMFGYFRSIGFREGEDFDRKSQFPKPKTILANIEFKYDKWAFSDAFLDDLWYFFEKTPINPISNRHYFIFTVVNSGMITFAQNWFCSLNRVIKNMNSIIVVSLDSFSHQQMVKIGANSIHLHSNFTPKAVNNRKLIDFYDIVKVRPTLLHQFLLWGAEPVLSDLDIIFLSDPFPLFKGDYDFIVQCDSKNYTKLPISDPIVDWKVNLGFYQAIPTESVMKLMPIWLTRMYNAPKMVDQSALRHILRSSNHHWIGHDTIGINWSKGYLKFKVLDPMLVVNAGGVFGTGRKIWQNESHSKNISEPVLCHFFHLGSISEKLALMKHHNLWFLESENKCKSKFTPVWAVWK